MIILMKHLSLSPSLGHFDPPSLSLSPSCTARFSLPLSLVRPRGTATGGRVYIPTHTHTHTQSRRRAQQQQRRAVLNIARARARHRRCSKYNAEHLSPRLQSAPRKRARRFSSILLYILSRHCYFLTLSCPRSAGVCHHINISVCACVFAVRALRDNDNKNKKCAEGACT